MVMGRLRETLDIEDRERGIRDGFAKHGLRIRTKGGLEFLVAACRGNEGELDTHPLHRMREQVVRAAVD